MIITSLEAEHGQLQVTFVLSYALVHKCIPVMLFVCVCVAVTGRNLTLFLRLSLLDHVFRVHMFVPLS